MTEPQREKHTKSTTVHLSAFLASQILYSHIFTDASSWPNTANTPVQLQVQDLGVLSISPLVL